MSDRYPAQIRIGGKVPRGLVPALIKAIGDAGVGPDYGDSAFEAEDAGGLLAVAARTGGVLTLGDAEACYGEFDELEALLREHGVAFTRKSEAKYEYDGEVVEFRPGMEEPRAFLGTQGGRTTVPAEDVLAAVKPLRCAKSRANAREVLAKLDKLCGGDVPPLEPLSVV